MKIKLLNRPFLMFVFIAIGFVVSAQSHFKYKATLDSIKQSGFYRVPLTASILAKCQREYADLRILDNEGNPTAYLLQTENGAFYSTPMIDLPITKKEKGGDKQWHITVENSQKRDIDRIVLTVKGTNANRNITLSGSDDAKNWYVITENYTPEITMFEPGRMSIYFPSCKYKYFQITLLGKDLLPIDIEKVSIYSNKVIAPQYFSYPLGYKIVQHDSSNKKSYVKIIFDEPYPIEKIDLQLSGVKYFKRNVAIYNLLDNSPLIDTIISSQSDKYSTINLTCKEKELWFVIDNLDDKPLKVNSIQCYQYERHLDAYFDSTKRYTLYFGETTIASPNYDITSFKDSITKLIKDVSVGNIEKIDYKTVQPKLTSNKNEWLIWACIGIALVLLLSITLKMLKEIGGRKK